MLQDVFPSVSTQRQPEFAILVQLANRLRERVCILRFDDQARACAFYDLARLAIYAQNHGPGARHEFEHLGRNYSFEDVGFLEQYKAGVRRRDERGNFFAGLLVEEEKIFQIAGLRQSFDASFFGSFTHEEKEHCRIFALKLSGGIEQGLEPMRHPHRTDVANEKLAFRAQLSSQNFIRCFWQWRE